MVGTKLLTVKQEIRVNIKSGNFQPYICDISYFEIDKAIPAIMGANVGTPITSTLVAFGNVAHPKEFRNAMARHFIF